jgi:hypothetical protein
MKMEEVPPNIGTHLQNYPWYLYENNGRPQVRDNLKTLFLQLMIILPLYEIPKVKDKAVPVTGRGGQ